MVVILFIFSMKFNVIFTHFVLIKTEKYGLSIILKYSRVNNNKMLFLV